MHTARQVSKRTLFIICIALCSLLELAAQSSAQAKAKVPKNPNPIMQKMDLTSELCFVQPEVSGRMNAEESKVLLNNDQSVTLMGGQAACFYLYPDVYSFRIEFMNSERMFRHKSTSQKYSVTLSKGERAVFEVYPATKKWEYTGGWRARPLQQSAHKK